MIEQTLHFQRPLESPLFKTPDISRLAGEAKAKVLEWTNRGKKWISELREKVDEKPRDVIEAVAQATTHNDVLVMERLPQLNESHESVGDKPKVIVTYGQHGVNEEIAKRAAARLQQSGLPLKTQFMMMEHPSGLDYVDAYHAAKNVADSSSSEFPVTYQKERIDRLNKGRDYVYQTAIQNPDAVVFDIHATPAGSSEIPKEGIFIRVDLGENDIRELHAELKKILPSGKSEFDEFPVVFSSFSQVEKDRSGQLKLPVAHNAVSIELINDYATYDSVSPESDKLSHDSKIELNQLRKTDPNQSRGDNYQLLGEIDREVTKSARILEITIPVIAKYYRESVLQK